jgi:hypothetical protein
VIWVLQRLVKQAFTVRGHQRSRLSVRVVAIVQHCRQGLSHAQVGIFVALGAVYQIHVPLGHTVLSIRKHLNRVLLAVYAWHLVHPWCSVLQGTIVLRGVV